MAYVIEVVNGMLAKYYFNRNILSGHTIIIFGVNSNLNLMKWFCYRAISIDPDCVSPN